MNQSQMLKLFTDNNFTVEENQITYKTTESTKIRYHCNICKTKFYQMFKDFKRRGAINGCSGCKTLANKNEKKKNYKQKAIEELEESKSDNELEIQETPDIIDEESKSDNELEIQETPDIIDEETGEIWKKIPGGWISSKGRAKNNNDKLLTLCKYKNRYFINGKNEYATRLVAVAFKIEGYEKILDKKQNVKVYHIDKNKNNNNVENLSLTIDNTIKKSNNLNNNLDNINSNLEYVILDFLPNYRIYSNGQISNSVRFLKGSISEGYLRINFSKRPPLSVHRLVCFAFNPLPWFSNYEEYENLQVNHIDGNTLNNSADNLEWCEQSENMIHAYQTGLNKKCRVVLQYDKYTDELIGEYPSIAEASRQTEDREYHIRESAKKDGKKFPSSKFIWRFKNSEETAEYTRKYSSKTKKK